jgi:hypothetical protein
LGLGDVELNSNLGEKFLAKVDVTDVPSISESSCFSATDVSDIPAFKKASINLKANNNGNFQLTVSTNDVITEPIVNLRISFNCEPNVNREYVLLLDPAPLSGIENTIMKDESSKIEPNINSTKKNQNRKSHQTNFKKSLKLGTDEQTDKAISDQSVLKKVSKKMKGENLNSVNEKLLKAYTGKRNSPLPNSNSIPEGKITKNTSSTATSEDKPFLVISTGNTSNGEEKPSLSLRLATEIDVARPDEVAARQSTSDTMDEVTVMSNRLSYLEKQITSLQTRNAQLVTDAQKAKKEGENLDWLQFSKIMLAILAALGVLEFLRRKIYNRQAIAKEAWFDDEKLESTYSKPSNLNVNETNEFDTHTSNLSSFTPNFIEPLVQNLNTTNVQKTAIEENSSILEDAEVFIEHGRPLLAAQLLQNYLIDSPAESPAIWLKLLDLLSKEGTESEYDTAVVECNKNFNIKAAKYGSNPLVDNTSIEDYPHILTRLEGVWGSPYAIGFLNDLIFNKRSQPREGLVPGAFNDLFFLKNLAKNLELSNSTIYKASPDQTSLNQENPNKSSANQTSEAATNIENTQFNDALFTDIENLADISTEPKSKLNDIKLGTKSSFNSFENDETSYEVNIIPSDEIPLHLNVKTEHLEFELPEKNFNHEEDKLFSADEINFSQPVEKVKYASNKANDKMEEIVLDNKATENRNIDLEFPLDFTNEVAPKPNSANVKTKSKIKAKPSTKNPSESNEIEWDLPSIQPQSKK